MSFTFPGEEAFSAPETAALKMAIEQTQNVTAFFSIHSYSQWILLPYDYTEEMVSFVYIFYLL